MLKNLKKIIAFLLILPVMFVFTACGKSKNPNNNNNQNPPSQSQTGGSGSEGSGNENQGGNGSEGSGNENQGGNGSEGSGNEGTGGDNTGSGDDNTGDEDDGNQNENLPKTLSLEEFIEAISNFDSKLVDNYKSNVSIESNAETISYEQLVNISYTSGNDGEELVTIKSSISVNDVIESYLVQNNIIKDNLTSTSGVVINENEKIYYYIEDFNAIAETEKPRYKTLAQYEKLLGSIAPVECFYFYDGSFIDNIEEALFVYIIEDTLTITQEVVTNGFKYTIEIEVSESEKLIYEVIYENSKLKLVVETFEDDFVKKTTTIENKLVSETVEIPNYGNGEYSQEYYEIIEE